jgi:glucokinase
MNKDLIAGIDVGGTKIAVALADSDGSVLSLAHFPTQVELGPHRIIDGAMKEIERMAGDARGSLATVGIGCGGPLDRKRGVILSPPNLPGWDEFPIVELAEKKLGVPALLDNDANAAALGEYQYGAGRGFRNLVYMTISTGIGGGILINGELVHGVGDGAGEVGHIPVLLDGPICGCGARGCLESLCSGTSIARRAKERLVAGEQSSLLSIGSDNVTAKTVAEAALRGDALANEIWEQTVFYLAYGLNSIIATLAPEAIILGGGVSTAGEQLLEPLRRRVNECVKIMPVDRVQILQASLGANSGIHGALILARRALSSR